MGKLYPCWSVLIGHDTDTAARSFARQSCIGCKQSYPKDEIKEHIANKTIPRCHRCKDLVKPEIVFFGEQLPAAFFENRTLPYEADLCIVMGTSLSVQPFASLPQMTEEDTPRVLINQEQVGGFGSRADDVLLLGDCDTGVRKLAEACGWLDQLERIWAKTDPNAPAKGKKKDEPPKTKDEQLEDEIEKLTKEVDESLNLSKWHEEKVRREHLPAVAKAESDDQSASFGTGSSDSKIPHENPKGDLSHVFTSHATNVDDDDSDGM